jgi:hypothetical protein
VGELRPRPGRVVGRGLGQRGGLHPLLAGDRHAAQHDLQLPRSRFLAPYVCRSCDHEEDKLLDVQTHFTGAGPARLRRPPELACDRCGGRMELDDLPERYLSFLNDA